MQVSAYCLLIKVIYEIFKLMDVIYMIYPMPLCGMVLGLTFAIRQMTKRMTMKNVVLKKLCWREHQIIQMPIVTEDSALSYPSMSEAVKKL